VSDESVCGGADVAGSSAAVSESDSDGCWTRTDAVTEDQLEPELVTELTGVVTPSTVPDLSDHHFVTEPDAVDPDMPRFPEESDPTMNESVCCISDHHISDIAESFTAQIQISTSPNKYQRTPNKKLKAKPKHGRGRPGRSSSDRRSTIETTTIIMDQQQKAAPDHHPDPILKASRASIATLIGTITRLAEVVLDPDLGLPTPLTNHASPNIGPKFRRRATSRAGSVQRASDQAAPASRAGLWHR
ncbi:hypothetical protein BVRB_022810, partial [Beta vulgaris subsp. vulgaris]